MSRIKKNLNEKLKIEDSSLDISEDDLNDINKAKRLEASKRTILNNHGVDSIFKKESFKIGYKNIMIDKYGVDNPMKHGKFVNNLKETLKEKQLNNLLPKLKAFNLKLLDEYTVNKDGNS
jgi:hypothetical protein